MLVERKYKVLITNRNVSKFKRKYSVVNGEHCLIDVNDLSKGSHLKVDVVCDVCDRIFERLYKGFLSYRKLYDYDTCSKCKYEKTENTNIKKYGVKNPFQSEEFKEKAKQTLIEKYGVDNPAKSQQIQDKIKKTNLKKYGYEYGLSNPEVRILISETKSKLGIQRPTDRIDEFTIYRNKVNNLTKINKSKLLESWDGYDHYDQEYIKDNYSLDPNDGKYPTIDHKKSILNSFIDNDSIEICSDINNICITKRNINSSKGFKNENEFDTQ